MYTLFTYNTGLEMYVKGEPLRRQDKENDLKHL